MKYKDREQQKFLKVGVVFWEKVSIHNSSCSPVVNLTYCHQDIDNQVDHILIIEKIVFFQAEQIISTFSHQLKDLDEDVDE